MTKRKQTTPTAPPDAGKPSAEQALMSALAARPSGLSTAELANAAGVGRSTASKLLARLESTGRALRTPGGRDGARRLPDRWTPASSPTSPASKSTEAPAGAKGEHTDGHTAGVDRLRPGQLDGLVLGYLKQNARSAPHGPTAIANALGRSSGAVGNCLVRLTLNKQVQEISEKPRRYTLAT